MDKKNDAYGIGARPKNLESKAAELTPERLAAIGGRWPERIRISLRLQRLLGLRLEESIKIQPMMAVMSEGDAPVRVEMHGSWCKNGRERSIEISSQAQRDALCDALQIVSRKNESLAAPGKTYVQYRNHFYYQCGKIGLRPHSLRHQFAQEMYRTLTGRPAPIVDPNLGQWLDMGGDDESDLVARLKISAVLGHSRKNVTSAYLGSQRRAKQKTGTKGQHPSTAD